jgi:hypothetical protein
VRVFQVHEPAVKRAPAAGKALRAMPKARHVFVATKQRGASASDTATPRVDGLLAYEVNGTLVTRLLQSR